MNLTVEVCIEVVSKITKSTLYAAGNGCVICTVCGGCNAKSCNIDKLACALTTEIHVCNINNAVWKILWLAVEICVKVVARNAKNAS